MKLTIAFAGILAGFAAGSAAAAMDPALLAFGQVEGPHSRSAAEPWLAGVIQNLEFTTDGKKLLAQWRQVAQREDTPIVIDLIPFGDRGHAGTRGEAVTIDSRSVDGPADLAVLLAHEWLGHRLIALQLARLPGDLGRRVFQEPICRVRGWSVALDMNPDRLWEDEDLKLFLKIGPKAYWDTLLVPDRVYFTALRPDEMSQPAAAFNRRAAAAERWLKDHPTSEGSPSAEIARLNLRIARGFTTDAKVLGSFRRAAADPRIAELIAGWDKEMAEFCGRARPGLHLKGSCP